MVGTSTTSKMFTAQKKFALENMNTCHRVTTLYMPDEIHTALGTRDMFFLMHYAYTLHSDLRLPEGLKVSCLVPERLQLVPMMCRETPMMNAACTRSISERTCRACPRLHQGDSATGQEWVALAERELFFSMQVWQWLVAIRRFWAHSGTHA